jgi:hypothetical protein
MSQSYNPSYGRSRVWDEQSWTGQSRQIVYVTLSLKYTTENRAGGVSQEVEQLLGKHVALSSNTSTTIIKKIR